MVIIRFKLWLFIALLTLLFSACVMDDEDRAQRNGEVMTMRFGLETTSGVAVDDSEIRTVRILIFRTASGQLIANRFYGAPEAGSLYNVKVESGLNDIYVVCNETPAMSVVLGAAEPTRNEIESLQVPIVETHAAPLPMYASVRGVQVTPAANPGDYAQITPEGGSTVSQLSVQVKRLTARLNMTFIKNVTNGSDFTFTNLKVRVCHLPKYSYLGEGRPYTETTFWADDLIQGGGAATLTTNGDYTSSHTVPAGVDKIELPSLYIPEHILSAKSDPDRRTYLVITGRYTLPDGVSGEAIYRFDLGHSLPANPDLLRNTEYNVYATIRGIDAIGFYATIVPTELREITVNWKPFDGLVIVSELASEYGKNTNIWNEYDQYFGYLKMKQNDIYTDVVFRNGTVIAIAGPESAYPYSPDKVVWKPDTYITPIPTDWTSLPVSAAGYVETTNTVEGVANGLGDPCRLVALSQQQIREGIVDNRIWRMANHVDYQHIMQVKDIVATDIYAPNSFYNGYYMLPRTYTRMSSGNSFFYQNHSHFWTLNSTFFRASTYRVNPYDPSKLLVEMQIEEPVESDRLGGYSVRCVRAEGAVSDFKVSAPYELPYTGGSRDIPVTAPNVPYWKAELVAGDASAFSFKDSKSEGRFSDKVTVLLLPLSDVDVGRQFTIKFTGYGLDGVLYDKNIVLSQSKIDYTFSLNFPPTLTPGARIPREGGSYSMSISVFPAIDTAKHPDAKCRVRVTGIGLGSSSTQEASIYGSTVEYEAMSTVIIPENTTGEVRSLVFSPDYEGSYPTGGGYSPKTYIQEK